MEDIFKLLLGTALAFSGWGKVWFDHRSNKPRITGRVLNVMRGQVASPDDPSRRITTFTTYLYLLNSRNNLMHILDYEMEAHANGKWQRLDRMYGVHTINNLTFLDPNGKEIIIERFKDNLIYVKNEPAQKGVPLHGWIVFGGEESMHGSKISKYKLTCIDANLKKHIIKTKVEDFANLALLRELANIQIPIDAVEA